MANPPLVAVLAGIVVGLTPLGSVLFLPDSAAAQVRQNKGDTFLKNAGLLKITGICALLHPLMSPYWQRIHILA